MRLVLRIDPIRFAPCAALCTAIALITLPIGVCAQAVQTPSATLTEFADAAHAPPGGTEFSAARSPDASAGVSGESGALAAVVTDTSADAASVNAISLDDQMLSRQRGGAVGMVMVAATPQLLRGNSGGRVTLWDEIAPPSPLPIPVDAARSAQSNVVTYQRK